MRPQSRSGNSEFCVVRPLLVKLRLSFGTIKCLLSERPGLGPSGVLDTPIFPSTSDNSQARWSNQSWKDYPRTGPRGCYPGPPGTGGGVGEPREISKVYPSGAQSKSCISSRPLCRDLPPGLPVPPLFRPLTTKTKTGGVGTGAGEADSVSCFVSVRDLRVPEW